MSVFATFLLVFTAILLIMAVLAGVASLILLCDWLRFLLWDWSIRRDIKKLRKYRGLD